jgi:hypothetical protein
VLVVLGEVIGHSRNLGVDAGAPELLGSHVLARRRFHQGRPAEKDGSRPVHDHRLIAHRGNIGAAGGAHPHDRGKLGDPRGAQDRLVSEDAAEVIAIGKNLRLERQERSPAVDEIDAGKLVLQGDLLRSKVLLHGDGVVRPAFHGGVVRDDHARAPAHQAHAADDPPRGHGILVELVSGECADLEKRGAFVAELGDAIADEELPLLAVPSMGLLVPSPADGLELPLEVLVQEKVESAVLLVLRGAGRDLAANERHEAPCERK